MYVSKPNDDVNNKNAIDELHALIKVPSRSLNDIRIKSLIQTFTVNLKRCTGNMSVSELAKKIVSVFKIRSAKDVNEFIRSVNGAASITSGIRTLSHVQNDQSAVGSSPAVFVGTIHSAKGREWSTVMIPFVNEGVLPSMTAFNTDEERRVMYVGMTRARHNLVLFCSDSRGVMPSRFIAESGMHPIGRVDNLISSIIHM
jgi:superfamily I DNA/RNA helicase